MLQDFTERDEMFMAEALVFARKALAENEFPVGCVMVSNGEIVATGARENSSVSFSELDHAELVALRNLQSSRPDIDLSDVTVYSTMEPCLMCYSTLVVNGVKNVVYGYEDAMGGGTNLPLAALAPLYKDISMEIRPGVLRSQCLQLFKKFFSSSDNTYLKDTYLARYTLDQ